MTDEAAEPILSNDETDALLEVMRAGAATGKEAKDLSLGSADDRMRAATVRADDVARALAPEVKRAFRKLLGVAYVVQESSADVVPYSVFSSSLAPGTTLALVRGTDPCCGFIALGPKLTANVLGCRLGAAMAPGKAGALPRPALSAVDRRVLRPFCAMLLELFVEHFKPSDEGLALGEILPKPADAPRIAPYEPLLRVPFTVQLGEDSTDEISVLVTSTLVSQPDADAQPAPVEASLEDRARLAARLTSAEVELVATLGHTRCSVRDVLALEVGHVLRLNEAPDLPVVVSVEGQRKMLGLPTVNHGNIAIEVTEILRGTA